MIDAELARTFRFYAPPNFSCEQHTAEIAIILDDSGSDGLQVNSEENPAVVDVGSTGNLNPNLFTEPDTSEAKSGEGTNMDSDEISKDLEWDPEMIQELLAQTPQGHSDIPSFQQRSGLILRQRYLELGNLDDLEASANNLQTAVDLTLTGHPDRAGRLQSLSISLTDRYRRLGDLKDLEAALQAAQEAAELTPAGHPDRAGRLQNLAVSFKDRYRRLGDLKVLEGALQADQEAVELTPAGHPDRASRLQSLAVSFRHRYQRLGDLKDLEAALQVDREAVELTPAGHPNRAGRLQNLAVSFTDRYQRLGDLKDLEAALQTKQEAVELTPAGHPNRAGRLQNLAMSFTDRYRRLGDLKDLEAAMQADREAVELTPTGHPDRAERLQSLAVSFGDRYQRLGDLKDLEAALQAAQEAVELTPAGHPDRAGRLQNLALSFGDQYQRLGDLKDLEAALQADQEAVELTPAGHPDRAGRLQNLAVSFTDRYQRLGDLKDLEAALQAYREAVELTPTGLPDRAERLGNLALAFTDRYRRLGDLKDLEAALQAAQEAVGLTPSRHPDRAGRLQSLSISLTDRYRRLGDLKDQEAALQAAQEAAELTPAGHPDRAGRLRSLAVPFRDRYQRLGDLKDLEAALQAAQEATELTPAGHPDRAGRLQTLAVSFKDRYQRLGDLKDLEAVNECYHESFKLASPSPENLWTEALQWASFSEEYQSSYCILAYRAAFARLPEVLWIGHSISVRHDALSRLDIANATSRALQTCINLPNLHAAVEFLEQGLATVFQQMLQLQTDVDALPLDQAQTFRNLSSQLYSGTFSHPISLVERRNELIQDIRKQPGLEYFLLPKSYNDLCHASQGGPVVILSSHEDGCNAIILLNPTSDPVHVPLATVTLELLKSQRDMLKDLLDRCSVRDRGQSLSSRLFGRRQPFSSKPTEECFQDMLNWLWTEIVEPVYKVLKLYDIINGRLWWLPTGGFTGLPLHASPPTDDFIHSYTATLGSLLNAYAKKSTSNAAKLTVIGVTHTDSSRSNSLKGVEKEVEKIVSVVKEPRVQSLVGKQATVDAVKLQLQDCSWVHLACHGRQDVSEPTKSHLMLYEGTLDLETILRMPLPNAQFVFLAACQTAMGDAKLVNESFHLGGGFITAGFRSAIGTMWSMHDSDGPTVAEVVYSHLFRNGQEPQASDTAKALQLAVNELKKQKVPYERWVPFIHLGI
ncbi:CHAT domain-containing protein [Mycena rebaudengoi]|nr:CHAT domain-containing protein [Mycena rebaudengoi]